MPGSRASIPTLSTRMRTWTYQRKENENTLLRSLSPPELRYAIRDKPPVKRERLRRATKEGGAAGPESRAANKQSAPGDSGKIHANPWFMQVLGKKRN